MRMPKVKTESNATRKKREQSEKEILVGDLAKRISKGEILITTLGTKYKLLNVEEDVTERWDSESRGNIIARLINYLGTKIPGRGKNRQEAIMNAILHLESMGYNIVYTKEEADAVAEQLSKKKKKGIPFQ